MRISLYASLRKKVHVETSSVKIYYSGILDIAQRKSQSIRVYERVASVVLCQEEDDGSS
jgi:hypothetical protein